MDGQRRDESYQQSSALGRMATGQALAALAGFALGCAAVAMLATRLYGYGDFATFYRDAASWQWAANSIRWKRETRRCRTCPTSPRSFCRSRSSRCRTRGSPGRPSRFSARATCSGVSWRPARCVRRRNPLLPSFCARRRFGQIAMAQVGWTLAWLVSMAWFFRESRTRLLRSLAGPGHCEQTVSPDSARVAHPPWAAVRRLAVPRDNRRGVCRWRGSRGPAGLRDVARPDGEYPLLGILAPQLVAGWRVAPCGACGRVRPPGALRHPRAGARRRAVAAPHHLARRPCRMGAGAFVFAAAQSAGVGLLRVNPASRRQRPGSSPRPGEGPPAGRQSCSCGCRPDWFHGFRRTPSAWQASRSPR